MSLDSPIFILRVAGRAPSAQIHPIADGNRRAALLFQTAVLINAGVLPERMFSFERYYAEDRNAYYSALRSVRARTFNMEFWLEYFLAGLVEEYERVATTVADLSILVSGGAGQPLQLTSGQQQAVAQLRIQGRREFSRRDYEDAASVSRSTAGDELRQLISHGILEPRGAGSATRYAFTGGVSGASRTDGRGRKAKWTDATIERELRAFLAEFSAWPSQAEFAAADRRDLYAAASRSGGIRRWRAIVGM